MANEFEVWKVRLIYTRQWSRLYALVSKNLLREICTYYSCLLLPAVCFNKEHIDVYDLLSAKQWRTNWNRELRLGVAYCLTAPTRIIVAGGCFHPRGVVSVDLISDVCTDEDSMQEERKWPGITRFNRCVYLFGGIFTHGLSSCEKWDIDSRTWTRCSDMPTAKMNFTPCVLGREIYLPDTGHCAKQLEVYTPATDQYRLLSLVLPSSDFRGSVSFIIGRELIIFSHNLNAYSWRVDSEKSALEQIQCSLLNNKNRIVCCPVFHFQDFVYWPNLAGQLVKFDVKRRELSEPFD